MKCLKTMRKVKFANNEYYHIYNCGVDKRDVFCNERDYARFLFGMKEFNNINPVGSLQSRENTKNRRPMSKTEPLVELICYCLNQNHYHMLLKQIAENGISEFMKRIGDGYTKYFNYKNNRFGSLFQGKFKSIHIDNNEYLLWLSAYINGNSAIHKISGTENHKWCSYDEYIGEKEEALCNKGIILSQFKKIEEYNEYVKMVIKESKKRKDALKYYLDY